MEEKNHYKTWLNKKVTLAKWRESFYKSIINELKTGERYVNYFKQYEPDSVERFISRYADAKVDWYEQGDSLAAHSKRRDESCFKEGVEALRRIQAKKLFNLLCRWVNYEIELPGIEISEELVDWQHSLFTCPFLEPVTQHEVDTYISYINNLPYEEKYEYQGNCSFWSYRFSTYYESRWDDQDDYSLWFRWFDKVYNIEDLKDKPALRINKEMHYRDVARDNAGSSKPAAPEVVRKPRLDYYTYKDTFVKKFETSEYRKLYDAIARSDREADFDQRPQSAITELCRSDRPIAVESNEDWRIALENAAELYKRTMVIEELPYVYDEYCDRLKSGKGFAGWKETDRIFADGFIAKYKEMVKAGRAILGEPADLNF